MAKPKEPPHALYGDWSCTRNQQGRIVTVTGAFDTSDHAKGAMAHAYNAHMIDPKDVLFETGKDKKKGPRFEKLNDRQKARLEKMYISEGDNCAELRLSRHEGDLVDKYCDWASKYDLLPSPKQERQSQQEQAAQKREQEQIRQELQHDEEYGFPFKVQPERLAIYHMQRADWEMVEAGYPTPKNPHGHEALVLVTKDPELAFQAAVYLKNHSPDREGADPDQKEQFITNRQFWRLLQEIKHQLAAREPDVEFRIAVRGEHMDAFEAQVFGDTLKAPPADSSRENGAKEVKEPPADRQPKGRWAMTKDGAARITKKPSMAKAQQSLSADGEATLFDKIDFTRGDRKR